MKGPPLPPELSTKDTGAAFVVVEGDPLDHAGDLFGTGRRSGAAALIGSFSHGWANRLKAVLRLDLAARTEFRSPCTFQKLWQPFEPRWQGI